MGENGEEQEAKDEIITEPSSIFNRPPHRLKGWIPQIQFVGQL